LTSESCVDDGRGGKALDASGQTTADAAQRRQARGSVSGVNRVPTRGSIDSKDRSKGGLGGAIVMPKDGSQGP
jgi:hypothetical protein